MIENGIFLLGNKIRMIMLKVASCFRVPILSRRARTGWFIGRRSDNEVSRCRHNNDAEEKNDENKEPLFFLFGIIMPFLFPVDFEGHL